MIVQSTEGFVESLNRLSKSDAKTAKRFLRALCEAIEQLPQGLPLSSIALSNYQVCEERGGAVSKSVGDDKLYSIFFDQFYTAMAVLGKSPRICQLLLITKKEP